MYVGPKVGPGGQDVTDAVIAWSDNDGSGSVGPDVLRFLFTAPGAGTTSISSDDFSDTDYDGVEIARMHGDGRMGVGVGWNNLEQPKRSLDVMNNQDDPQMRLSHTISGISSIGTYAEFLVSDNGDLYISPESNTQQRALAVGFLPSDIPGTALELPQAPSGIQTILDVNGLTRIRNLPAQGNNSCLVIGSRAQGAPGEDNYLKRLAFTGNTDEYLSGDGTWETLDPNDCRWIDVPSTTVTGETDIFTDFPQGENCDRGKVGIGVDEVRRAKLEVENLFTRDEVDYAIYGGVDLDEAAPEVAPRVIAGVFGEVHNGAASTTTNAGVYGRSEEGRYQVGVYGFSQPVTGVTGISMGVAGVSEVQPLGTGVQRIGVYGEVVGVTAVSSTSQAGYFVGGITSSSTALIISDESVKTNIQDISEATQLLNQLQPRSYEYVSPENRPIPFDQGTRFGFVAQEIQDVLPQLVAETTVPERIDSTGFVEGTSVDLLGVKYTELIPILVAGFKEQSAQLTAQLEENQNLEDEIQDLTQQVQEQQAIIESLENQMNDVLSAVQQMQSNVTNCCGTAPVEKGHSETGNLELEQNFPNPFETETTINFTLAEAAQIRLEISDAQGRVLEVLVNENLTAGSYTERWDAYAYAPGIYYYSLYADTELLTKKMIKK